MAVEGQKIEITGKSRPEIEIISQQAHIRLTGLKCQICKIFKPEYSCPRCNLKYCSKKCFNAESHLQCSEIFYKKQVLEYQGFFDLDKTLQREKTRIMLENHENNLLLDENGEALGDCDLVETDLDLYFSNPQSLSAYKQLLIKDLIFSMVQEENWIPWWLDSSFSNILEVSPENEPGQLNSCVDDNPRRKLFNEPSFVGCVALGSTSFNPLLPYCIIDLVLSYIYTIRSFNGDVYSNVEEFRRLFSGCGTLGAQMIWPSVKNAVSYWKGKVGEGPNKSIRLDEWKLLFDDLKALMSKRSIGLVLGHVYTIFYSKYPQEKKIDRKKNILISRRLGFFIGVWNLVSSNLLYEMQQLEEDPALDSNRGF